jgi:hypothetical protein
MASRSAITASSSAMSGLTASRLHAVYGAGAVTYIKSAPRRTTQPPPPPAVTAKVSGRRKASSRQLSRVQPRQEGAAEEATAEVPENHSREGVLLHRRHSRRVLRCSTKRWQTATTAPGNSGAGCIREAEFLGRYTTAKKQVSQPRPLM